MEDIFNRIDVNNFGSGVASLSLVSSENGVLGRFGPVPRTKKQRWRAEIYIGGMWEKLREDYASEHSAVEHIFHKYNEHLLHELALLTEARIEFAKHLGQ